MCFVFKYVDVGSAVCLRTILKYKCFKFMVTEQGGDL